MKFIYHAKTKEGERRSGTVDASSKEAALVLLQKYNLFVTFLEKAEEEVFYKKQIRIFEKVTGKDLVVFSRQMSLMLGSKVPLSETLSTLAYQTKKRILKEVILKVTEEVEGGTAFSAALSSYPKIFSPFFIAMVKSGEVSGKLSDIINYLASYLEQEQEFHSKIKGAMVYPAFVFIVFLFIFIIMIFVLIPQLSEILMETGQELPSITKFVLSLSDFLKHWGLVLILPFFLLLGGTIHYYKTEKGKKFLDKFFLMLPLIGDFLKKIYLSRLAENLSTLISGGIPISKALEITAEIVGNDVYTKLILETRDGVRRGEPMSLVFQRHPESFSPIFTQMVLVGERAGRLDIALKKIGEAYQKEVGRTLEVLLSLLEPAMIVFLGFLVGGLVISVLIPIYRFGAI